MKCRVFIYLLLIGFNLSAQNGYLHDALLVEKYLNTVSIENEGGLTWPLMPEKDSIDDITMYSGMPGIVLFYLELFNASEDKKYLRKARNGADYLMGFNIPDTLPPYQLGLYTGAAGMAFTLEAVYQTTNDEKYLDKCLQWMKSISIHLDRVDDEERFGGFTDIVYGASGIGLTALHFLEMYQKEWMDELLVNCADYILLSADEKGDDLRWKMSPQVSYYMDNFSHGTAGNAFFLLRAYQHTGNDRYKEAAFKASEYLLKAAV